jgi:GntR family transcriptional repressor for pyruvate dehydrogenase complex
MDSINVFENLKTIQVENPADKIIRQLKQLITTGQLKPGDRLPAERILAERFGVGRSYVREAIMKLEFYGLLKTSPQSGTYVSGYSIKILDSIISDIINLHKENFTSLIEARYYMELDAVKLAAERRTDGDLKEMEAALDDYDAKVIRSHSAVDEDMIFHIKIAGATKNSVIESMMLILIPDIIRFIVEKKVCGDNRDKGSMAAHREILAAIGDKDPIAAEKAMANHLHEIMEVSKQGFANMPINNNYLI